MRSTTFDLKPLSGRATRLDRSCQLIWVEPNVLMCLIKSNVVPHKCLGHVLGSAHGKFDVSSRSSVLDITATDKTGTGFHTSALYNL